MPDTVYHTPAAVLAVAPQIPTLSSVANSVDPVWKLSRGNAFSQRSFVGGGGVGVGAEGKTALSPNSPVSLPNPWTRTKYCSDAVAVQVTLLWRPLRLQLESSSFPSTQVRTPQEPWNTEILVSKSEEELQVSTVIGPLMPDTVYHTPAAVLSVPQIPTLSSVADTVDPVWKLSRGNAFSQRSLSVEGGVGVGAGVTATQPSLHAPGKSEQTAPIPHAASAQRLSQLTSQQKESEAQTAASHSAWQHPTPE